MEITDMQLKDIGFEIELYKSFFVQCKETMSDDNVKSISGKMIIIKGQINLTDRLFNKYQERKDG